MARARRSRSDLPTCPSCASLTISLRWSPRSPALSELALLESDGRGRRALLVHQLELQLDVRAAQHHRRRGDAVAGLEIVHREGDRAARDLAGAVDRNALATASGLIALGAVIVDHGATEAGGAFAELAVAGIAE